MALGKFLAVGQPIEGYRTPLLRIADHPGVALRANLGVLAAFSMPSCSLRSRNC